MKYVIATYQLRSSKTLEEAAKALAIGQSVGNPYVRNVWETDQMWIDHAAQWEIVGEVRRFVPSFPGEEVGTVKVHYPLANWDPDGDGISQLMCQLMGGQMDIDIIRGCVLQQVELPLEVRPAFPGPRFGITGIRKLTGQYNKPLLGAIIKPKVGLTPQGLRVMVSHLVDGGVDFIKEDEIMANPRCCPLRDRIRVVQDVLPPNVIYAYCINGDGQHLLERAMLVAGCGGNAVHVNFWCGLQAYRTLRQACLPLHLFFQKSGDRILTDHRHDFHIAWRCWADLACQCGVDFIHTGMWGGYCNDDEHQLRQKLNAVRSHGTMPTLSCGMHPGLVHACNKRFGVDYLANVGGAIHGHPGGTFAGATAMRQAIDNTPGDELKVALEKWGSFS